MRKIVTHYDNLKEVYDLVDRESWSKYILNLLFPWRSARKPSDYSFEALLYWKKKLTHWTSDSAEKADLLLSSLVASSTYALENEAYYLSKDINYLNQTLSYVPAAFIAKNNKIKEEDYLYIKESVKKREKAKDAIDDLFKLTRELHEDSPLSQHYALANKLEYLLKDNVLEFPPLIYNDKGEEIFVKHDNDGNVRFLDFPTFFDILSKRKKDIPVSSQSERSRLFINDIKKLQHDNNIAIKDKERSTLNHHSLTKELHSIVFENWESIKARVYQLHYNDRKLVDQKKSDAEIIADFIMEQGASSTLNDETKNRIIANHMADMKKRKANLITYEDLDKYLTSRSYDYDARDLQKYLNKYNPNFLSQHKILILSNIFADSNKEKKYPQLYNITIGEAVKKILKSPFYVFEEAESLLSNEKDMVTTLSGKINGIVKLLHRINKIVALPNESNYNFTSEYRMLHVHLLELKNALITIPDNQYKDLPLTYIHYCIIKLKDNIDMAINRSQEVILCAENDRAYRAVLAYLPGYTSSTEPLACQLNQIVINNRPNIPTSCLNYIKILLGEEGNSIQEVLSQFNAKAYAAVNTHILSYKLERELFETLIDLISGRIPPAAFEKRMESISAKDPNYAALYKALTSELVPTTYHDKSWSIWKKLSSYIKQTYYRFYTPIEKEEYDQIPVYNIFWITKSAYTPSRQALTTEDFDDVMSYVLQHRSYDQFTINLLGKSLQGFTSTRDKIEFIKKANLYDDLALSARKIMSEEAIRQYKSKNANREITAHEVDLVSKRLENSLSANPLVLETVMIVLGAIVCENEEQGLKIDLRHKAEYFEKTFTLWLENSTTLIWLNKQITTANLNTESIADIVLREFYTTLRHVDQSPRSVQEFIQEVKYKYIEHINRLIQNNAALEQVVGAKVNVLFDLLLQAPAGTAKNRFMNETEGLQYGHVIMITVHTLAGMLDAYHNRKTTTKGFDLEAFIQSHKNGFIQQADYLAHQENNLWNLIEKRFTSFIKGKNQAFAPPPENIIFQSVADEFETLLQHNPTTAEAEILKESDRISNDIVMIPSYTFAQMLDAYHKHPTEKFFKHDEFIRKHKENFDSQAHFLAGHEKTLWDMIEKRFSSFIKKQTFGPPDANRTFQSVADEFENKGDKGTSHVSPLVAVSEVTESISVFNIRKTKGRRFSLSALPASDSLGEINDEATMRERSTSFSVDKSRDEDENGCAAASRLMLSSSTTGSYTPVDHEASNFSLGNTPIQPAPISAFLLTKYNILTSSKKSTAVEDYVGLMPYSPTPAQDPLALLGIPDVSTEGFKL